MGRLSNFKDKISNEAKLISFCARVNMDGYALSQVKELVVQPLDWERIIQRAIFHGVAPLIYQNLNKINLDSGAVPQWAILKLKNCYFKTLFDNLRFWKEFQVVLDEAKSAGVKIVPIKGIILAQTLYHDMGQRPMNDIDLLIPEDDLPEFEGIALRLGYKANFKKRREFYRKKYYHHLAFKKENYAGTPLLVEAHWNLTIPGAHKILFPRFWQRIQEETIDGARIPVLSPEDTLCCLVLHLRRHAHALILRHFCDIAEWLKKYENNLDWSYIIEAAEKNKIKSVFYFAIFSARQLLGAPVRSDILDKLKPSSLRCRLIGKTVDKEYFYRRKISRRGLFGPERLFFGFLLFDKTGDFLLLDFTFSLRRRCEFLFSYLYPLK